MLITTNCQIKNLSLKFLAAYTVSGFFHNILFSQISRILFHSWKYIIIIYYYL